MHQNNIEHPFLSVYQFAGLLDVSSTTVANWVKAGILVPAARTPSGKNMFTQAQVDKMRTMRSDGRLPSVTVIRGEPVFSAKTVAAAIGVHPKTVGLWTRQGRLVPRSRTPGGWARYSQAQIDELVQMKKEGRLPPPLPRDLPYVSGP